MSSPKHFSVKQFSAELTVGILFFAALAVLAYFTIILSKEAIFRKSWDRTIRFPSVAGLSEGDSVRMRGVKIGTVRAVRLEDSAVIVDARLDTKVILYQDAVAEVEFSSILGGRYVSIQPGDPGKNRLPEDAAIQGVEPADMFAEISKAAKTLQTEIQHMSEVLSENQTFDKMAALVDDLHGMAQDLREGKGTLGRLLTDEQLYADAQDTVTSVREAAEGVRKAADNFAGAVTDARAGQGTIGKLLTEEGLYEDLSATLADIRAGKGTLGKLINEETLHQDISATAANLRQITDRLQQGDSSAGRLLADNGELYESITATFDNAREVTDGLKQGTGTIGRLLQDETLYEDLRRTIAEVRNAVEDFREQAPISTFGSFVFGAL
jgi:phospholipid/cholesterol/gamma-HCH transport system substrate-binding protein